MVRASSCYPTKAMAQLNTETVTDVTHWNDDLFSFRTTRDPGFRFENGHFTMIGIEHDDRPLLRAYSIASANYEDELEFFSIKVQDGALTSRLQHLEVGDPILVSRKPTGTLTLGNVLPGKRLFLVGTGTGLAPFIGLIKDPEIYESFDQIILVHGVRWNSELAYQDRIRVELPKHEYLGDEIREKLLYYPTVTREPSEYTGRVTELMTSGKLFDDLGLPQSSPETDRYMLCGSPQMLTDIGSILDGWGFSESRGGYQGEYAIERAFVEK